MIQQTGRRSFEQLVMLTVDVLVTPRLVRKDNWRRYARFTRAEYPKWLMKEGMGLIMVTAHYGNFELIGYMMGLFGFDVYSVARPLDNKYLNRFLYDVRQRHGLKLIDKKGAAQMMPKIIEQGSTLGSLRTRTPDARASSSTSSGASQYLQEHRVCWRLPTTCRSSSAARGASATVSSSTMS